MSHHEREFNDDVGLSDTITLEIHDVHHAQAATQVELAVTPLPPPTTAGLETEHIRTIRYSYGTKDGIRYVEVVDGIGEHVASGMGEAADALTALLLYLLPEDHQDYPRG